VCKSVIATTTYTIDTIEQNRYHKKIIRKNQKMSKKISHDSQKLVELWKTIRAADQTLSLSFPGIILGKGWSSVLKELAWVQQDEFPILMKRIARDYGDDALVKPIWCHESKLIEGARQFLTSAYIGRDLFTLNNYKARKDLGQINFKNFVYNGVSGEMIGKEFFETALEEAAERAKNNENPWIAVDEVALEEFNVIDCREQGVRIPSEFLATQSKVSPAPPAAASSLPSRAPVSLKSPPITILVTIDDIENFFKTLTPSDIRGWLDRHEYQGFDPLKMRQAIFRDAGNKFEGISELCFVGLLRGTVVDKIRKKSSPSSVDFIDNFCSKIRLDTSRRPNRGSAQYQAIGKDTVTLARVMACFPDICARLLKLSEPKDIGYSGRLDKTLQFSQAPSIVPRSWTKTIAEMKKWAEHFDTIINPLKPSAPDQITRFFNLALNSNLFPNDAERAIIMNSLGIADLP